MSENVLSSEIDLVDRVVELEKKVKVQDDELVCLKSALSEAIRRLNQLENSKSNVGGSSRVTQSAKSKVSSTSREPKLSKHKQASPTKAEHHFKKVSSSETQATARPKNKEIATKDSGDGIVKIFLKGRPLTFYAPTSVGNEPLKVPCEQPPKEKLVLEWVYGYRGKDCRNNIVTLLSGEIVYFSAAVAVIYDTKTHQQRHYSEHNDDIKCIALHPDKVTLATGQMAGHDKLEGKAHVRIWSSADLSTLKVLGLGDFERAISCLSFSKNDGGAHLAVVDEANDHVLSLWQWEKAHKILDTKSSGDAVFFVDFNPLDHNLIVTCGKSHINFWTRDGNNIAKKTGIFEKLEKPKFVTSLAFNESGDVLTGDSNGNIHVWLKGSNKVHQVMTGAHEGGVFCIYCLNSGLLVSGGKDKKIVSWKKEDDAYIKNGNLYELSENEGSIRQITELLENVLVVGTTKNNILMGSMHAELSYIVQGHVEETWGLEEHPSLQEFVTCGNDKLVQVWSSEQHKMLRSKEMPEACHTLCLHPNGELLVVTGTTSKWYAIQLQSLEIIGTYSDASERIECAQFSPDGNLLACGSRDNFIYIYSLQESKFQKVAKLSGHSSFILHLDWSEDGQYLQSNSGDYELLFWNMGTFKQVLSASSVRDVAWNTTTCTLSFAACGIWPDGADGTDVNASSRSHNSRFVASADDFGKVNLFNYPCFHPKSAGKTHTGHSSHVTNVKFLEGDNKLVSIGGKDASVLQWKLINI